MNVEIVAKKRDEGKKSDLNNMRNEGFIPAVIYGVGKKSTLIKVQKNIFLKEYKRTIGELVLFDLKVANKMFHTIIKDKQIHPVTRDIIHIDFMEVSKDKKLTVDIPFRFTGTPIGVKNGGSLDVLIRTVQASCLPSELLEDIEIDLTDLDIGQSIHVSDIDFGDLEISIASDITIAVVHQPRSAEETVTETVEDTSKEQEAETEE